MLTNTLGFCSATEMALTIALVVFIREFQTFCLKLVIMNNHFSLFCYLNILFYPGVQRRLGSSTFCPAKLTTASQLSGSPLRSNSCQVICLVPGIRDTIRTSYPFFVSSLFNRVPMKPVPPPKHINYYKYINSQLIGYK